MTNNSNLPKPQKDSEEDTKMIHASAMVRQIYTGPIPPASELEHYEKIQQGAANRIISMAEKQSKHRQQMESKTLDAGIKLQRTGQILGFIILLFVVIIGFVLLILDKDAYGIAAIITAVASIIGLFVYGRRSEKREVSTDTKKKK